MQDRIAVTAGSTVRGERLRAALTHSGIEAHLVPAGELPSHGASSVMIIDVADLPDAPDLAGKLAARVPVLVVGAPGDLPSLEEAIAAGADDLAVDPGPDELASRVWLLLRKRRRRTALRPREAGEVREFVRLHGGPIGIDAPPGGNTTAAEPRSANDADAAEKRHRRPSVLLVEDDEDMLDLLADLLQDNFEIFTAADGEEGVQVARAELPDAVLLDLFLPRLDGFGALEKLRRDERTAEIPVIFLSGHRDELVRARGLYLGAADFVAKPFSAAELRARIDKVLQATRNQAQLRALAREDALTGLPNFRAFRARLEEEVKRARRYRNDLSAVMLDLDNLKPVNDQLGHAAGNRAIVAIADAIRSELRETDFAARYGGDEFVLLLPHTDATQARVLAERLRRAVRRIQIDGGSVPLGASFGVASLEPGVAGGGDALVRAADAALYHAKRTGRDKVCVAGEDVATEEHREEAVHEA